MLKIASNEGDTILDPFMGVGSTGVAALMNNRKFIGIELEKDYYKAAMSRLKSCDNQKDLFSVKIEKELILEKRPNFA